MVGTCKKDGDAKNGENDNGKEANREKKER